MQGWQENQTSYWHKAKAVRRRSDDIRKHNGIGEGAGFTLGAVRTRTCYAARSRVQERDRECGPWVVGRSARSRSSSARLREACPTAKRDPSNDPQFKRFRTTKALPPKRPRTTRARQYAGPDRLRKEDPHQKQEQDCEGIGFYVPVSRELPDRLACLPAVRLRSILVQPPRRLPWLGIRGRPGPEKCEATQDKR
jgi:hypothetical protein